MIGVCPRRYNRTRYGRGKQRWWHTPRPQFHGNRRMREWLYRSGEKRNELNREIHAQWEIDRFISLVRRLTHAQL